MTDVALPASHSGVGDFRIGRVIRRTASVVSRHFPIFVAVNSVAALPVVLLETRLVGFEVPGVSDSIPPGVLILLNAVLALALEMPSQAAVLHATFQLMRGRPVSMVESFRIALRRFFPLVGLGFVIGLVTVLVAPIIAALPSSIVVVVTAMELGTAGYMLTPAGAALLAASPVALVGLLLFAMWFVAISVCVIERKGPIGSLGRSRRLTKGHRGRIFGICLGLLAADAIVLVLSQRAPGLQGRVIMFLVGRLAWHGVRNTLSATVGVVTYHDLRVAKENVDTEQITSVFE
jgi:hypothetical protein